MELRILQHLQRTLAELSIETPAVRIKDTSAQEASLAVIRKEQKAADAQKSRLYDLLEMGEYDIPTFRERMAKVKDKIAALEQKEAELLLVIDQAHTADPAELARRIKAVLDAYDTSDAAHRNALLKGVIQTVWYRKKKKTAPSDFQLTIDLKYN